MHSYLMWPLYSKSDHLKAQAVVSWIHHLVWQVGTDVSEQPTASIFKVSWPHVPFTALEQTAMSKPTLYPYFSPKVPVRMRPHSRELLAVPWPPLEGNEHRTWGMGKGTSTVHSRTGHEVPEREQMYNCSLSLTSAFR